VSIPALGSIVRWQNASKPTVAFAHLGCREKIASTRATCSSLLASAGYGISADENEAALVVVNNLQFHPGGPGRVGAATLGELPEKGKGKLIIAGLPRPAFPGEFARIIARGQSDHGHGTTSTIWRCWNGWRLRAGQPVSAEPPSWPTEHLPRYRTHHRGGRLPEGARGLRYRWPILAIIPKLRGTSAPAIESIVAEAHQLAAKGVKEAAS